MDSTDTITTMPSLPDDDTETQNRERYRALKHNVQKSEVAVTAARSILDPAFKEQFSRGLRLRDAKMAMRQLELTMTKAKTELSDAQTAFNEAHDVWERLDAENMAAKQHLIDSKTELQSFKKSHNPKRGSRRVRFLDRFVLTARRPSRLRGQVIRCPL